MMISVFRIPEILLKNRLFPSVEGVHGRKRNPWLTGKIELCSAERRLTMGGPCDSLERKYADSVEAQRETQRKLNWVNNPQNEAAAAKFGKDRREYREWQESVEKASAENNKAATRVKETFDELQKCKDKYPPRDTGGGQTR